MPTQPLTPTGVANKVAELYALSDTLLFAQADSVESDFRAWMAANFTLTTAQSDFLSRINDHAAKYYGAQSSVAFRSRLSVSLSTPSPEHSHKWIDSVSSLIVSTNADGVLQTTGSLTFTIEYRAA